MSSLRLQLLSAPLLLALTAAADAQSSTSTGSIVSLPTAREVSLGLSPSRTDLQRDAYWETIKGQKIRWRIEVTEVTTGWFSGFKVRGRASSTLQVSCELEETPALKATVAQINKGDLVVCEGNLGQTFLVLFGVTSVIVNGTVAQ